MSRLIVFPIGPALRHALPASLLFLASGALSWVQAQALDARLSENERRLQQKEAFLVIEMLQGLHYLEKPFRDFSVRELIERFADDLDPSRTLLLAGDVEFLCRRFEKSLKPVYLFKGDLHPAFEIYEQFAKRVGEWELWAEQRLETPFAFGLDSSFDSNRSKADRPANAKAQKALWEDSLKARLLGELLDGAIEKEALAKLREQCTDFARRTKRADLASVRERFLNSLLGLFDPHSGYFSRDSAEAFEIEMSGALVGIGIDIQQKKERFVVHAVHEGGPADVQGGIFMGDEVLAVAEKGSERMPLKGRALRDVSKFFAGKAGTEICLCLRSGKDAPERSITLARGRVDLGPKRARGSIFSLPWGGSERRLGVISIPAFYGDGDSEGSSLTTDVVDLLRNFSAEGVEGLVIDLRNNGGGLMKEAVSLAGLFLRKGTVVQSKGLDHVVQIFKDEDDRHAYAGPLVVLMNGLSASASEVFAGAMRCHRRALILGESRSFGKGSVQGYIDLRKSYGGQLGRAQEDWGMLRVTQQLYFLPDGSSPQLKGISPDLELPSFVHPGVTPERDMPKALPSLTVSPVPPEPDALAGLAQLNPELKASLLEKVATRIQSLPEHDYLRCIASWYGVLTRDHSHPLNLEKAKERLAARDADWSAFRKEYRSLRRSEGYAPRRVDIPAVMENHEAHQKALRRKILPDGKSCINRFHQGTFTYEARPGARIEVIDIEDIDFDASLPHAEDLSRIWSTALGQATPTDSTIALLKRLSRPQRQWDEDPDYPALFAQHAPEGTSERVLSEAIDAFVLKAVQIDKEAQAGVRALDVALRESLRCCADWIVADLSASEASSPRPLFPEFKP